MEEVTVASWNELNEELYRSSWRGDLHRFRSNYAYRGMTNPGRALQTSLMRIGPGYEQREGPLLRTFRRYAERHLSPGEHVWNWMAVGQHYGLPTRMLDWTYSPYVALHFATQDLERFDVNSVIWCVDYVRAAEHLPPSLQAILREEGAGVFTVEMLAEGAPSLAELDGLTPDPFVVFLEPPSLDDRIINQFALFSLMSSPTARLDEWLESKPHLARRVIIPAGLKWEVRDKLDQANITERVLFPGLDGLSRWLRRYYTTVGEESD